MRLIIIFIFFILISGCVTFPMPQKGGRFSGLEDPMANKALVYVYRKAFVLGMGGANQVFFAGAELARLDNSGFSTFHIDPGCYKVTHTWPMQQEGSVVAKPFDICVEGNKRYILKIIPQKGTYSTVLIGYTPVSSGQFLSEIHGINEQDALQDGEILNCRLYPPYVPNSEDNGR